MDSNQPPEDFDARPLSALLRGGPDPVWVLDADLKLVDASDAYCNWVGRAWKWLDGRHCPVLALAELGSETRVRAVVLGTEARVRFGVGSPSGPADTNSAPPLAVEGWRAENGGRARIVLWGRPSSGASLATGDVAAASMPGGADQPGPPGDSSRRFEQIVYELPTAVLVVAPDGNIRYANQAAAEIVGASAEDAGALKGTAIARLLASDEIPLGQEGAPSSWSGETYVRRYDGADSPVHLSLSPLSPTGDEAGGTVILLRDVSDERRIRRSLMQTEKMSALGRMISGVAHELNNPLTSIIGFAQLLIEDLAEAAESVERTLDPDATTDDLRRIHGEALRCKSIVENMVKVARQEATTKEMLRIDELLDETLSIREYELGVHNVVLERNYQRNLPPVMANHDQLQQVVLSILGNAYDAIRDGGGGGTIAIGAEAVDGKLTISFEDSGPGIEDADRVFDPFYTTKEVGQGVGLGLTLAYGIVREHGGKVTASNRDGTRGARFAIELPSAQPYDGDAEVAEVAAAPEAGSVRILLVDDEESILQLCRRLLQREGFSVQVARDGREALQRLAQDDFDLVVSDFRMPGGVHGVDLYHWICRNRPTLRHHMILSTGDAADAETKRIIRGTGLPCVMKPFDLKEFLAVIQRVLAQEAQEEVGARTRPMAAAPLQ